MSNWHNVPYSNSTFTYYTDSSSSAATTYKIQHWTPPPLEPATYSDPAEEKKAAKKVDLAWLDSRVAEITELVPV